MSKNNTVIIRVDEAEKVKLKKLAKENKTTMSGIVRTLINTVK